MNAIVLGLVLTCMVVVVVFLLSRRCNHTWETIDHFETPGKKKLIYIQRCRKCGTLKKKVLK